MSWDGIDKRKFPYCNCGVSLERIEADVKLIKLWITGNGDPDKGLLTQASKNTDFRKTIQKWMLAVLIAASSSPFTLLILFLNGRIH